MSLELQHRETNNFVQNVSYKIKWYKVTKYECTAINYAI